MITKFQIACACQASTQIDPSHMCRTINKRWVGAAL